MKTKTNMRKNNVLVIVIGTVLILMVPLVAMLFTDEVKWGLMDFAIISSLLLGAGLLYELITSKVSRKHQTVIAIVLAVLLLLFWIELAVGLLSSPLAGT